MSTRPEMWRCLGCGRVLSDPSSPQCPTPGLAADSPPPRCPECGWVFDPADPRAIRARQSLQTASLEPNPWGSNFLALLLALFLLVFAWLPGSIFAAAGPPLLIVASVAWAMGVGLVLLRRTETSRSMRRRWRAWFTVPAIGLMTALLLRLEAPAYVTFLIAKPDLDRLVEKAQAMSASAATTQPVPLPDETPGIWRVYAVEAVPGGVHFMISGSGFLGEVGLQYVPGLTDAEAREARLGSRFWGDWYYYSDPQYAVH